MTFQDAALLSIISVQDELAEPGHTDRDLIEKRKTFCATLYEDNGSGDLRVLEECLSHTEAMTAGLDNSVVRDDLIRSVRLLTKQCVKP